MKGEWNVSICMFLIHKTYWCMIFSPFFTLNCLSCHQSNARPTNLDVTCLRMSIWLYLLNKDCTNFSVTHIQSLNDIGLISSPKKGMSLWMGWCNSWLLCLPKCTLLCLSTCIRLEEEKLILKHFWQNNFFSQRSWWISKEKIMEKISRDTPKKGRWVSWTNLETKPFLARDL